VKTKRPARIKESVYIKSRLFAELCRISEANQDSRSNVMNNALQHYIESLKAVERGRKPAPIASADNEEEDWSKV
jgi:metal-responsive CopG/Arc/MetJ family transcriptional regulator